MIFFEVILSSGSRVERVTWCGSPTLSEIGGTQRREVLSRLNRGVCEAHDHNRDMRDLGMRASSGKTLSHIDGWIVIAVVVGAAGNCGQKNPRRTPADFTRHGDPA
jgi:hypothetical protein